MPSTGYCDAAARTQLVARLGDGFVIGAPDATRRKELNLDAQLDRVDAVIRTQTDAGTVGLATDQIRPGLTLIATTASKRGYVNATTQVRAR